ncbi:HmuY family protein [Chitinophaga solisilvae]|uniref:HmuY family protein n=1 Tax=Chitinophaga solisilvae TaxID=1233460 RepID=UPI00136FBA7B|nr:HmuY family protein [Chitinophaga solisilvae]
MRKQLTLLLSVVLIASCSKSDDDKPANTGGNGRPGTVKVISNTAVNVDADAGNKGTFTLYNLAENKVVPNSDSATAKWDIGFKATTIIINGGVSGPGKASAQVVSGIYNDMGTAPEAGYKVDEAAAKAITGWYSYNMDTHIISPVAGKFFVLKTADGKYAKLEIFSYYKDAPNPPVATSASRYYHFRYVLQPDGSAYFK